MFLQLKASKGRKGVLILKDLALGRVIILKGAMVQAKRHESIE
jgi:hypothetical protein